MKTKLLIALLFVSGMAAAQSGYVPRNVREALIATAASGTTTVPAGAAPTLNNGWPRSGALYVDSVGGGLGFHYYLSGTWRRLVDSSEVAGLGIYANGITKSGDTAVLGGTIDKATHIQLSNQQTVGSLYTYLHLANRPSAEALIQEVSEYPTVSIYNPTTLAAEALYEESEGDTAYLHYGGRFVSVVRNVFDSTSTRFAATNKYILLPSNGFEGVYQFMIPRDTTTWRVGRDGQSANVMHSQWDLGDTYGYNTNVVPETGIPGFPLTSNLSSIDLMRNIDVTRSHKMSGTGVSGFTSRYKTYQSAINMSTYEAGNYTDSIFGYTAYGDIYPQVSGATKAKTLAVWDVKNAYGFYAHPQYRYTNTVRNGYAFYAAGDSDQNRFNFVRIGGAANNFLHQLEVTGDVMATDSVHGFIVDGYALSAKIPVSIGTEANVVFGATDSVQAASIGMQLPANRDARYLAIRVEGFNAATYPDNSNGMYIRFETGGNHANVSRISRNGNWTLGNTAGALAYRYWKKLAVAGGGVFMDTLRLEVAPLQVADDTTNNKIVVRNTTTGDLLTMPWVGGSGGGGSGSGIGAVYNGYGLLKSNDSTLAFNHALRDSIIGLIPAQLNPTAGTNVTITGTYPNLTWNAAGDANWVFLSDYGTPDDGLSDTAAIKAAVATGKNVYVTPGEWLWDGYRCTLNTNQIIRGYGPTSIIRFTQDIADVFFIPQGTHHVQIDYINFIGKGRGALPGGEVFTFSNAIFIQGDSNRVQYCNFKAVKGSGVTGWVASGTMYANEVSFCRFDSCGVGIYAMNNMEYSLFGTNQAYYCRVGFMERCAGNNTWDFLTSNYNDYGGRIYGTSGCNGDHGSLSNSRFNHNSTALDIQGTNVEYVIQNVKFYQGNIEIGSADTARRVVMDNCVFSGNTINVTRASQSQITGGTFSTSAVTVNAGAGMTFCNIQNSPYSTIACGSVLGTIAKGFEASDSLRERGTVLINDSTLWKLRVINPVTGAVAYANWLYAGSGGGGGMTNPMTTADDIIYSTDGSGTPGRLAKGADGTFLGVSGGALGYYTPAGGGNVSNTGTPVNNQLSVWTNSTTIEGDANLTWDGTTFGVTGASSFSTSVLTPLIIGGTGTTSKITHKSTTGTGTGTAVSHDFLGGTNGNVQNAQFFNNGSWALGTSAGFDGYGLTKLPNGNGGWLDRDQFGNNIRLTTHQGFSTFSAISGLTNTAAILMKYTYLSTGTVANGLGVGMQFETENGSGTQKITGQIDNIYTDITNTSEDADFVFRNIRAGTLTEAARFTSVGGFSINGSVGTAGQVLTSGGAGAAATWSSSTTTSSGTYAPTLSSTTNVASSTGARGFYTRVGDVVEVTITVQVTPTASATLTSFSFTLPVSSNFTTGVEGAGDGGADGSIANHLVLDTTNDLLTGSFTSTGTVGVWYTAHFKYTVQ